MLVVRKKATRSSVTGGQMGQLPADATGEGVQNSLARNINFMTNEPKIEFDKLAE